MSRDENSPDRSAYRDTIQEFATERNALGTRLNQFSQSEVYKLFGILQQTMRGYEHLISNVRDKLNREQYKKGNYSGLPRLDWSVDTITPFSILRTHDPLNSAHIERNPPHIYQGKYEGIATSSAILGWIRDESDKWNQLAKEPMGDQAKESDSHYLIRKELDASFSAHLRAMQITAGKIAGILQEPHNAEPYDNLVQDLDNYTTRALAYQKNREGMHQELQEAATRSRELQEKVRRTTPDLLLAQYAAAAGESDRKLYEYKSPPPREPNLSHAATVRTRLENSKSKKVFGPALKTALRAAGIGHTVTEIHEKLPGIPTSTLNQLLGGFCHPSLKRRDEMLALITDKDEKEHLSGLWEQDSGHSRSR